MPVIEGEAVMGLSEPGEQVPLLPRKAEYALLETELLLSDPTGADKHEGSGTPSSALPPKSQYSLLVAICFALNYSIGSGILGLPYEFFSGGYVLGSVLLVYLGGQTYITYTYVMDGMQRAEAITIIAQRRRVPKHTLLHDPQGTIAALAGTSVDELTTNYSFKKNEYQLSELIGMFAGKWWKLAYDISYGISTLISLWSYSALFGISLARTIGIPGVSAACDMEGEADGNCRGLYSLYVCIFWAWTVVMSLMDFTEQQGVQIFATVARAVVIVLMIVTASCLIGSVWFYNGQDYLAIEGTAGKYAVGVEEWKWSGLAYFFAVSSFAYGNQYCITDVITPLSQQNRQHSQHKLWGWNVGICCAVYIGCGVAISLYFGAHTESPATLAWKGFMGFAYAKEQPIWAMIVSWFILLFPAIDIGSAYPLNAVTLANTIEAAVVPQSMIHPANRSRVPRPPAPADNGGGEGDNDGWLQRISRMCSSPHRYSVLFRVMICTLTAVFALIEWNFDLILGVSGAFGLMAVYIGPCILEWKSKQMVQAITNSPNTDVCNTPTTIACNSSTSWLILIVGTSLVAFFAVFVDIGQRYF